MPWMKRTLPLYFVAYSIISPDLAFARSDDIERLLGLSLTELSLLEVNVASKTYSPLPDAPGVVTAYSRSRLDQLGYNTLADLADITPGYSSYTLYGERVFETRGQRASSYDNQKHLLLIDGIPIAHARANKVITEEELPLYFAERVEFMRGPGSALYGTGAFLGVVNIAPKQLENNGSFSELSASTGSFDNNMRLMMNAYKREDSMNLSLNLGLYQKDASKAAVGQIDDPLYRNYDDQESQFVRIKYEQLEGVLQGWEAGIYYLNTRGGIGEYWMHSPISLEANDIEWTTLAPYLRHKYSFTDDTELTSYLKYNRSSQFGVTLLLNRNDFDNFDGESKPLLTYDVQIEEYEFQSEIHTALRIDRHVIFGVNMDTRKQAEESSFYSVNASANEIPIVDHLPDQELDRITVYSAYTQYQDRFNVLNGLLLTAGARLDAGESGAGNFQQVSPKLALVQKLDDRWNFKLLASGALRAPGLKETMLNNQIITVLNESGFDVSVPDLEPETMMSYELGGTYAHQNTTASLTLFKNYTTDTIRRTPLAGAPNQDQVYTNVAGTVKSSGTELEINYAFNPQWNGFSNYSYAHSKDEDGSDLADIPISKFNIGITYKSESWSATTVGKRINGYQRSDVGNYEKPEGFTVVDLNIIKQLTQDVTIEFQVRNLFQEEYKLPKTSVDYSGVVAEEVRDLGDVPIPERHFLISLNMKL